MSPLKRVLLFILLPIISILMYPPSTFSGGVALLAVVVIFMVAIGILLWRGRSVALTFAIFLQGMNVIIRMMMFFSHSVGTNGKADVPFIITSLLAIGLSLYLLLRLDESDIRVTMTA